jgi:hypothetical protein
LRDRAARVTLRAPMSHDKPLRVAVLGDVHGHLSLAYTVLRRLERETRRTLDLILQVGDMGAFPAPYRLDKATKRFAEHDPDELGFARYQEGDAEAAAFLAPDASPARRVAADTVFIRGNHEDFAYLAGVAAAGKPPVYVDLHDRIAYLPNGTSFTFARRGLSLRVAALGGVSDFGAHGHDPDGELFTAHEVRRVRAMAGEVDVLLTHEPAAGSGAALGAKRAEHGARDVAELLREVRPRYHFCGHWHEDGAALDAPAGVRSYQLNAVNFLRASRLNRGCMGVLTWRSPDDHAWEWVEGPWLAAYTRHTWRALMEADA